MNINLDNLINSMSWEINMTTGEFITSIIVRSHITNSQLLFSVF